MYSKIEAPNNEYSNLLSKNFILEDCIAKIANGDKHSLVILYESTKSSVYGFALSILRNVTDTEDILQEVYIKIYENAGTYQANGKPLAWILTITKNLSFMKLRKQKDTLNIDDMYEVLTKEENNANENKLILKVAFECLSDEERNILILHANSGFKHREIAKLLNLPLSTVLSKYHRAIKKIKKVIREEDII